MFPPDASPPEINGMKPSVSLQVSSYLTAPCVARTDCEVSCGNLAYLNSMTNSTLTLRKEVIQPHLPIRLPCYDFTPVIGSTFGSSSPFHCVRAVPYLLRMLQNKFCNPRGSHPLKGLGH